MLGYKLANELLTRVTDSSQSVCNCLTVIKEDRQILCKEINHTYSNPSWHCNLYAFLIVSSHLNRDVPIKDSTDTPMTDILSRIEADTENR